MDVAINEERIIITFDRDYGELVFKVGFRPKKGIDILGGRNLLLMSLEFI